MRLKLKAELMAPAGGFDSLQAALDNGADSIYFGVDQLNMHARATLIGGENKKGFYTTRVDDDEFEANKKAADACLIKVIQVKKV